MSSVPSNEEDLKTDTPTSTLTLLSKLTKEYLDREYPLTQFPKNEKSYLKSMKNNSDKNIFLQLLRDGELEISLKLIFYKLIDLYKFNDIKDGYSNGIIHYCSFFNRTKLLKFFLELKQNVCKMSEKCVKY